MEILVSIFIAVAIIQLIIAGFLVVGALRYHHTRPWRAASVEPAEEIPTVSVLVPAFNEEATLANNLEGLIRQDHPSYEIIVIDDGSTDGTADVARHFATLHPGLIRVLSQSNAGKALALNHGLLEASGDVIVVVDADSILAPDALTQLAGTVPAARRPGGRRQCAHRQPRWRASLAAGR